MLSFLFALLLISSIISLAQDAPYQESKSLQSDSRAQRQPARDGTKAIPRSSAKRTSAATSPAVVEALEILESLPSTSTSTFSDNQPSGFLQYVLYYGKHLFRLLFMSEAPMKNPSQDASIGSRQHPSLRKAVDILDDAALSDDPDAMYLLAQMNFYGNFTHPRNYRKAFEKYSDLARLNGNSTAQYMVGLMYATGVGGSVERDQAKALLYHTTAAEQGNIKSEMTVAYRHHTGIGTPRNCDKAAYFYKRVADKAMAYWQSGPPGGASLPKDSFRWSDEKGGIYGEGASVVGVKQQKNNAYSSVADAIEYLDFMSRDGDYKAVFTLGSLYYDGAKGLRRDVRKAHKLFMKVAKLYWGRDGKPVSNPPHGIEEFAGKSAARIGRMFLRGELMEQSFEKAAVWFRRGVGVGNAFSQYQMGLLYRDGLGVPKDEYRAATYFKAAAEDDLASAQSALAVLFLDQGDVEVAVRYFEEATRHGSIEAFYYLAEIANKGIVGERHCGVATAYYKIVAEKAEILHSSFAEANDAYEKGDLETALIDSVTAAEQGYENAQSNVAYLLDSHRSMLPLRFLLPKENSRVAFHRNDSSLALIFWTRSAKQANIDSLMKMGDSYLSGSGTPRDIDKASACYHTAADVSAGYRSAQALWNLGWMHENGVSVNQDFHMAKRFYDLALEINSDSYLPVKLSLIKLRIRSHWNTLTHGSVNPIHDDADSEKRSWTLTEWIAHFLESADNPNGDAGDTSGFDELGLGSEAYHGDPMPGGDDNFDDLDDSLLESLIIVGLAATLAFLVYYRNQRQLQMQLRRQQQEHGQTGTQGHANNAQAQGRGLAPAQTQQQGGVNNHNNDDDNNNNHERGYFPQPGDPDFNNWVAGGVGH
ncbi:MAG: hypothetical protein Q9160_005033 [Pyrenula sp. 1 TL-2023]